MTDASSDASPPAEPAPARRILSIDALRGLDMMMILGLREVILALCLAFGLDGLHGVLESQAHHPEWNGFTAWDLIFPLFLFLAGASMPLSFEKRLARGDTRGILALHTARRAALLVFFGVVYNGLLSLELEGLRYASVLGRIGLAWAGAALAVLFLPLRGQVIAFAAVLAAHSAALLLVPAPGLDAVSLEPGQTFGDWFDRQTVPGRLHMTVGDPEGLFGVLSAIGTALLGSFAGRSLRRQDFADRRRVGWLVAAGLQCLLVGWLLDAAGLPVNKNLWTASFVLVAGGWSLVLLGLFHLVFDVVGAPRLGFVLSVVGANAILAYLLSAYVDYRGVAEVLCGRALETGRMSEALVPVLVLAMQWALLLFFWRRRLFLRV